MLPASDEWTHGHPRPVVVGPSLATELDVLVRAVVSPHLASAGAAGVGLRELTREVTAKLQTFWSDDAVGLPELVELALRGGSLGAVDYGPLRVGLDAAMLVAADDARAPDATGRLLVAGGGSKVVARIDELAHSRARWRIYLELIGDLWRAVEPWWSADGVLLARAASTRIDAVWRLGCGEQERQDGCGELVLAVSSLAAATYEAELPGRTVIVVGSRAALAVPSDAAVVREARTSAEVATRGDRDRTEPLARRLRSLGAPARLAMLDLLAVAPSSVGDLAQRLGLAQPTVSVHVKQLRDAGLVRCERRAGRIEVELDRRAVDGLLRELGALLEL